MDSRPCQECHRRYDSNGVVGEVRLSMQRMIGIRTLGHHETKDQCLDEDPKPQFPLFLDVETTDMAEMIGKQYSFVSRLETLNPFILCR
jgi:hypothetical protein